MSSEGQEKHKKEKYYYGKYKPIKTMNKCERKMIHSYKHNNNVSRQHININNLNNDNNNNNTKDEHVFHVLVLCYHYYHYSL